MNNIKIHINISKRVLEAIESQNVQPRPKWHFVVQESVVWMLGLITTFCGAVAVSTTLFVIATAPTDFQPATHDSVIKFWIEFIPVLWLILFASFIIATEYFLKKTKRGYRYGFVVLTLSSVTLSILLGYLGFLIGIGEIIDRNVGNKIPFHLSSQTLYEQTTIQPTKGLLTGTIVGNDIKIIETKMGTYFNLDLTQLSQIQKDYLSEGRVVSVVGTTTKPHFFVVCMIIPFEYKDFSLETFMFERKILDERTNTCKGVRPYDRLKTKILNYEN